MLLPKISIKIVQFKKNYIPFFASIALRGCKTYFLTTSKHNILPDSVQTKILPSATTGDEITGEVASYSWIRFPDSKSKTYSLPSDEPVSILSPQITGEVSMLPLTLNFHFREPSEVARHNISPSLAHRTMRLSLTAGLDMNCIPFSSCSHRIFLFFRS